jgi:formiminoglutamate deiminase
VLLHAELAVIETTAPLEESAHRAIGAGDQRRSPRGIELERDVVIEIEGDRIVAVRPGVTSTPRGAQRLAGCTLPGFVNAHSHAFHRALRGTSEIGRGVGGNGRPGSFWTWRDAMYGVAATLDPDRYLALATATYAEMALAGITTVGEFHYLHHDAGGIPYGDPNAMGLALIAAADAVGLRLTLLDACYLRAGIDGAALSGTQLRFGDHSAEQWATRVGELETQLSPGRLGAGGAGPHRSTVRLGAAVHSVRACDQAAIATVADLATNATWPLHVHLSEQELENEQCLALSGRSPAALLEEQGALLERTTAVHATHVSRSDIIRLGTARAGVCACPTTERDLADGIGPFGELAAAGAVLSIGSDSHAVIDPFEEVRGIELHERLATNARGRHQLTSLLRAGASGGARSLGWEAGAIAEGQLADLVAIALDHPRIAGASTGGAGASESLLARIVFGATAADVSDVIVGGRFVVQSRVHHRLGGANEIAELLTRAISVLS